MNNGPAKDANEAGKKDEPESPTFTEFTLNG